MTNVTDGINFADILDVTRKAYSLVNVLQDYRPAEQVTALGLAVAIVCQEADVDVRELLAKTKRMQRVGDELNVRELEALSAYVRGELKGKQL